MDSLQRVVMHGVDLGVRGDGQADLVRWKEGGVDVQIFAVWVDTIYGRHHAARRAFQQIDAFHSLIERYPDRIELARTGADITRIVAAGKLAALLAIEGGIAIQNDLALLRTFHRLGASSMTLTHSATIDWADASTDATRWGGLTEFGKEVVREMNRLGMVVDVSHVSDDVVRNVLEISAAAGDRVALLLPRALRPAAEHSRRPDARGRGARRRDRHQLFLRVPRRRLLPRDDRGIEGPIRGAERGARSAAGELDSVAASRLSHLFDVQPPRPAFDRLLDHIDHAVQVAGIDHVGLGSDLDSARLPTPQGMDSASDFPRITEGLLRRGYAEADAAKILGANFLRVFETVARSSA
jgi:membrane dipeptidase